MRKRSLIYLFYFSILLVISEISAAHSGRMFRLITVWFWQDLGPKLPSMPSAEAAAFRSLPKCCRATFNPTLCSHILFPQAGEPCVCGDGNSYQEQQGGPSGYLYHHYPAR